MRQHVDRASRWIYSGIWAVLVRWLQVPDHPPTIPSGSNDATRSFRPAEGFLRYLKFYFWFVLVLIDGLILVGWIAIAVEWPIAGLALAAPALFVAVLPDIVAYVAIHLRYDTTWYVVSNRSLRIRRGIWVLHETTITYENIQNIRVSQGPIQRMFGIADVLVETAGGGSGGVEGIGTTLMHRGLIEGVDNAQEIRDLILGHLRKTHTTGLGDEFHAGMDEHDEIHAGQSWAGSDGGLAGSGAGNASRGHTAWSADQLELLREIRAAARELAG